MVPSLPEIRGCACSTATEKRSNGATEQRLNPGLGGQLAINWNVGVQASRRDERGEYRRDAEYETPGEAVGHRALEVRRKRKQGAGGTRADGHADRLGHLQG